MCAKTLVMQTPCVGEIFGLKKKTKNRHTYKNPWTAHLPHCNSERG